MFLINTTIKVCWIIPATSVVYLLEDWDITIKRPDRTQDYLDAEIVAEEYLAPTVSTDGYVNYELLFDQVGLWKIALSTGATALHYYYQERQLQIDINDIYTKKFVRSSLL